MRRLAPLSLAIALGCARPQIDFHPIDPARVAPARDRQDVAVFLQTRPDWDYAVAGQFQEALRSGTPGGIRGFAVLVRERAAEEGCDGVLVGGNVSRFEGEWERVYVRRSRFRPATDPTGWRWVPVFQEEGHDATCIVRVGAPSPFRSAPGEWPPLPPQRFYSFGGDE